jgi:hypothetical protein
LRRSFLVWLICAARRKRLGVLLKSLSVGIRYALMVLGTVCPVYSIM